MPARGTAGTMLAASGLTVLGAIAPFLLGAQAVLLQRELGVGAAQPGLAVSVFFATAAVVTILGGRRIIALGRPGGLLLSGLLVGLGGLGLAALAHSWSQVALAMVVLGAANAACQATSNAAVATALPQGRRGLGFGIKQSAVPAAIMLGGLAVPTTTVLLGWRSTFVIIGVVGLLVAAGGAAALRQTPAPGPPEPSAEEAGPARPDRAPLGPLLLCGAGITLASAGANFIGAYLATWAHDVGLTVGQAGLLMAVGSGSSVAMRILLGHRADGRHGGNLSGIAVQMLGGAACLVVIGAVPQPWAVVVFGVLAFAVGWSWPGLLLYAVSRVGRDAPAQATSVIQSGAFLGGAVGPALFGLIIDTAGFRTAWWVAAGAFVLAAAVTLGARAGFRRDLRRRPPASEFGYGGGRERPRFTVGGDRA